ncbi:MAG: ArsB/NhaD family transporter [Chloroflexi bacterium]|nr:MAG: ArsB/NhaD family transporter [Chloroflexota bacterium]TMB97927.1 MAG: ArsB/NhaD family transporter [Chloroflexota bacterium]TMC29148.1 MAG: ArsB/NhaD family transporter [Chloroflexota bacterium]TMC55107.1 MAG: ArsB/NhaD family transporter [Chloroflexota bacterium]TME43567.1 MAG: ArsB/NhaD family transporter [Chloroflexota bacterium]
MSTQALLAAAIFAGVYFLIVTERLHRTLAALLGAVVVIATGLLSQGEAFSESVVDFNVIFLLAGMMVIANILAKTGLFQWIAVEAVRITRGDPYRVLVIASIVTAVVSAVLDNVTTVVLIVPVTFFIAKRLRIDPVPILISQILASNIGGTATLIGDPPNLIIGSRLGKDFGDFLLNTAPAAIVSLVVYLAFARWLFRGQLGRRMLSAKDIDDLVAEERRIADPAMMRTGLIVLLATIAGFIVARPLGLQGATIALAGAVVLMIVSKDDVHEILKTVEWSSLFFFIGLFIVVGAVVKAGLIRDLATATLGITGGRTDVAALLVLWMSAILSAIVDNIPYTITMVPLVSELGHSVNIEPLIWALSLGANLGGNATVIGASANVVVSSMAEAQGYPITFRGYLRYGLPATFLTMVVCTIDIWLRYLVFS